MTTTFATVRLLLAVCLFGPFVAPAAAQEAAAPASGDARVYGTVIDQFNGMTLPTAAVTVVGTDIEVFTDLDGRYAIDLPAGTYEIRSTFPGYEEKTVQVELAAGQEAEVDLVLGLVRFEEEVTVVGEAGTVALNTEEAQLVERKRAPVIQDNMSSQEMKANADSNAAAAMQRVTGLSVVDNQFVFVRGLGERYSSTTLGGAVLPTTEPDRKVVPLDLFPAGLLDSVQVVKSYSPDKSGEFAGGVVEINSLSFPDRRTFDVSLKQGWNGITTNEAVGDYPGGGTDWLGFDDGTRALPGAIPDMKVVRRGRFSTTGFTPEELQSFGRSFANVWEPRAADALQNQGYSSTFGGVWKDFGLVTSLSYSYRNQFQEEEQNFFRIGGSEGQDTVEVQNAYDFRTTTNRATIGVIANGSYRLTPNNQLRVENFWTNNSKKETRLFEGFNADIATDIRNQRLYWMEEGVLSTNLVGEHLIAGLGGSRLEWRYSRSKATREEPDLREVMYEFDPFRNQFVLADESQSGFRMFNDLEDLVHDVSVDMSFFFTQWDGLPAMVKFGPAFVDRTRDFASRRFRFTHQNTIGFDLSQAPEALFAPENIGPVFELREETRATDAYTGDQTIAAGYGMIDLPVANRFRLVAGARVERSEQFVDTFDPFNPDAAVLRSELDDTDVLPSLNAVYRISDTMNVRAGYSHTVNRPEFRELAPFEFTDVVGGRAVVGNPELQRALIRNVDLRWEWFPGASEVIAASVFYKDFEDPIERVVQATAQLRTSYENALGATNAGVELEARRELLPGVFAGVNYTFVDSSIEIERGESQVQTSLDRPLSGLSRHVFNGVFETRVPKIDATARLLYNYYGDRITDVGSLGLPDIIEQGRPALDLVFSWIFTEQVSFKLTFDNLTDSDYRYEQGGELQRLFRLGRTFGFSLDYHFW